MIVSADASRRGLPSVALGWSLAIGAVIVAIVAGKSQVGIWAPIGAVLAGVIAVAGLVGGPVRAWRLSGLRRWLLAPVAVAVVPGVIMSGIGIRHVLHANTVHQHDEVLHRLTGEMQPYFRIAPPPPHGTQAQFASWRSRVVQGGRDERATAQRPLEKAGIEMTGLTELLVGFVIDFRANGMTFCYHPVIPPGDGGWVSPGSCNEFDYSWPA